MLLSPEISINRLKLVGWLWGSEVLAIGGCGVEWKFRDDVELLRSFLMSAGVWSPVDELRSVVGFSSEWNSSGGRSEVHSLSLWWVDVPGLVVILLEKI